MRARGVLLVLLALAMAPGALAQTEYVRDEIRIKLRDGPGDRFDTVRVVVSGETVSRLEERGDWAQVRTRDGSEGWLPVRFLTPTAPASVALPRIEASLSRARERVVELEGVVAEQTADLEETEALRTRNVELQQESATSASRWRDMGIGAAILLTGLLLGAFSPRSSGNRGRRIKL